MPLGNMPDFSFKHVDQPDRPTESASTRKQQWDSQSAELRTFLNNLVARLNSATDNNSGADNIAMTPISETGSAATVQAVIEALIVRLKSATDGSSGADLVRATAIPSLDGVSVQEILESLRNKLKATTDGASGADFINATGIEGVAGTTIQALLESLKTLIDSKETPTGAQSKVNTHANRTDNPHGVTALQAGAETPAGAQAKVDIHANNKGNPHEVTALQTGAITQIAGLSNPGGNIGIEGGTGIAVATDPSSKKVILTATGTAVPGAHASAHGMYGTDPISPALIGAAGIEQLNNLAGAGRTTETVKGNADAIGSIQQDLAAHLAESATEAARGHIEIATQAEVTAGADAVRAVVPKYLKTELEKKLDKTGGTITGHITIASDSQRNFDIVREGQGRARLYCSSDGQAALQTHTDADNTNTLYLNRTSAGLDVTIGVTTTIAGVASYRKIYHEGNVTVSTTAPSSFLGNAVQHQVYS